MIISEISPKTDKHNNKKGYEYRTDGIKPFADYTPWNYDDYFLALVSCLADRTLVDIYRLYELDSLVKQCKNLPGNILEVGVYKGGTGLVIGLAAKSVNKHVYLADTFSGVPNASERDSNYFGGEHGDTSLEDVDVFLKGHGLENYTLLKGIFPEDTATLVTEEHFCFCHIDVDVYLSSKNIVEWLWPRLCIGGIVVFDDYGFLTCNGVTDYVNEHLANDDRSIFIYNANGHAIFIKLSD